MPLLLHECSEAVFADDLDAIKPFALNVPSAKVLDESKECQLELHIWGRANHVEFDFAYCVASLSRGPKLKNIGFQFRLQIGHVRRGVRFNLRDALGSASGQTK